MGFARCEAALGSCISHTARADLPADLDLRPFHKLLTLLGLLRCAPDELPRVLRRLPRSLESLCLTAENLPEPRGFDAALVRHLPKLRELSLYGHRRHDLAALRGVRTVRLLNPATASGEAIGAGANYAWPNWSNGSDSDGGSDSEEGSEEGGEASTSCAGGVGALAAAAEPAQQAGSPAGTAGKTEASDDDDRASSSSSSSSAYEDAAHGGHHRHGGGGGDDERHSPNACHDPYCPLHSGKRFLQVRHHRHLGSRTCAAFQQTSLHMP